jgi:NAD(P)-dependent dehydrogenase (short-subunit alcohol dehydrogenase family)
MLGIFRDKLFENRTALITGGSTGIGLRIAEKFAAHGARVALVGRDKGKLDRAGGVVGAYGEAAPGFAADVRDYQAIACAVREAREAIGKLDILVCAAAGNFPAPALGMSANGFKSVVDIDLNGTFNTCRAAFEHMRKPGASVVAISAIHGSRPVPMQAHVCAAKAGVEMLARVLALEWASAGVRVNAVSPGPVEDTEGMRRLTPNEDMKAAVIESIPLRRYATKDEVADLVLFLCSEAAAIITGAVFACDGGMSSAGAGFPAMPA